MPLPLETSRKVGITGRVKALGVLLLPVLIFAAVVFLASSLQSRLAAPRESHAAQPSSEQSPASANGWLSADTASSAGASVDVTKELQEIPGKGATTVTTYTVMGKF
jgi:hypothetical protein